MALVVTACQPKVHAADPAAAEAAALEAKGYAHAPVVESIGLDGKSFAVIEGQATPDGRVRLAFSDPLRKGGAQAVGVTADSNGHFRAEVPITPLGGLYDVSMDDNGRAMQAEGRLFVPPGQPDKAVLIRAGSPSLPLFNGGGAFAVVDYDARGAIAVSGHVAGGQTVMVQADGEAVAQAEAGKDGVYSASTGISPAGLNRPLTLSIRAGAVTASHAVVLAADQLATVKSDQISAVDGGWKIDWALPGGGVQSTLVF